MATNNRVSPRRFSTVPSSPANAPGAPSPFAPAPGGLRSSTAAGGDQLAKLPQIENKLLRLFNARTRDMRLVARHRTPFLFGRRRETHTLQRGGIAILSSARVRRSSS